MRGLARPIALQESRDLDRLVPLLREADEGDERIARAITNPANVAYLALGDDRVLGAAVVHWHDHETEIVYLAVEKDHRRQGHGTAIIGAIVDEARRRRLRSILVGTANSSLDNIAFYQRCGFRMDSIRKDYFRYFESPVHEFGIRTRDQIVFRRELSPED